MVAIFSITDRFVFEPRAVWGRSSRSYIVVYDKIKGKYVTRGDIGETAGPRAYVKFRSSDEAIELIKKNCPEFKGDK